MARTSGGGDFSSTVTTSWHARAPTNVTIAASVDERVRSSFPMSPRFCSERLPPPPRCHPTRPSAWSATRWAPLEEKLGVLQSRIDDIGELRAERVAQLDVAEILKVGLLLSTLQ